MTVSTTAHPSTDPAGIRADRRRPVESVAAPRRLLAGRRPFELADLRRLNREAAARARAENRELHAEHLAALTDAEREARAEADLRRAAFGETAERLLALRAELAAHVDAHGDLGLMERRTRSRAPRPLPAGPAVIPHPRPPGAGPKAPGGARGGEGPRGTERLDGGEHARGGEHAHDGACAHEVRPRHTGGGAPWAVAVVAALLVAAGATRRSRGEGTDAPTE
ncbi:hypothetical protein [Streptomyces sp. NPDC093089]|uniref:hypothetical protein n=1 Tax=Streptomyces sp. NPDC093089 TaxID=3366024 RepID=UPI00381AF0D4